MERDYGTAIEDHRAVMAVEERRHVNRADERQTLLDYAIDIGNIANVQLTRGEHAAAIDAYRRSLEIRERIAAADPKDVFAQGRVAFVHMKLATLYLRTGDLPRAREHAARS